MKSNSKVWSRTAAVLVAGMLVGTKACADSPWYPRVLLCQGDYAVLIPSEACFNYEIRRMELPPARFTAQPVSDSHEVQTANAELDDLREALRRLKVPEEERETVIKAHAQAREALRKGSTNATGIAAGLPDEFADYFRGSIAWHKGDRALARYEWELLLNRPATERRFKSTWAAFMLGKLLSDAEPEKAIEYFQQVRALASAGFADSSGLAASSIGWEARVHWKQRGFAKAFELYLEQLAGGDESARNSLRFVARDALRQGKDFSRLASQPRVRRVITAWAISDDSVFWGHGTEYKMHPGIAKWLEAVEEAKVNDPEEAEMLALAGYRAADFDMAERWIKRAPPTPVTLWLTAKLHVRVGKLTQALSLLTRVRPMFAEPPENEELPHDTLANNVFIPSHCIPPRQHILGEMGVLHMTRRNYVEALDCFLHGSFWMDGAYVAERVLTVEELKAYVDREWPAQLASSKGENTSYRNTRASIRPYIRHLLARRLVRNFLPAGAYFPDDLRASHDELISALKRGETEALPAEERVAGWYEGAKLLRAKGLELIGTELEPDWHIFGGWRDHGLTTSSRTNDAKVLLPSADELSRARRHNADPEERFHYRYQAAFIALQAANLLPDNSDQKARILCTAGTWIKDRDPKTADIFYKHLVRRCRKTPLGAVADLKRWFPAQDPNGDLKVRIPLPLEPVASEPVFDGGAIQSDPLQ